MKIGSSRFWDGFVRCTLYFELIFLAQYVFTVGDVVLDGCIQMGFPRIFYSECGRGGYLSRVDLYVDLFVWLLVACITGWRWAKSGKSAMVSSS